MFLILQRARYKLLCYYLVTFLLSNLWKFLDAIIYCTSPRFSLVQVSGENGGSPFIRRKSIRVILNELKFSILQSAGCSAIILMLQPAVVAMFSIMQRARHKLPCYYPVTFSLSNLWKFLDAIMYYTSEL